MLARFNAATAADYYARNLQIVADYDAAGFGQRRALAARWGLSYDSLRSLVANHRKRETRGGYSVKQWKVQHDVQSRLDRLPTGTEVRP